MQAQAQVENGICPHWNLDNYTDSLHDRLICKDECCKCFGSPKDESGLDVCLRCFVGSCNPADAAPEANHSRIHYQNSEHPLVLKIRKTPKQVDEPVKITKLAIGKPGGVDPETDEYDVHVRVYCFSCNNYLDHTHQKVQPLVDSILLAQSAYDQQAIGEWEMELKPCEHTLTLDQSTSKKIAEKSLAHCQECELKSNLWLCMTCGHLGCGRKNYDGSGGNNHGVEHFEKTGHGVNVKIGTITPEGKASIHCYKCDEEVLDNELAAHLGVLGIDVGSQVKTEKSIAEQELEANLSLTLSKVLEDGKTLVPVFGPNNTGMQNLGNTCYMNSVVQILFDQKDFNNKYASQADDHILSCKKFAPECFQCQMRKLGSGLASGRYSQKLLAEKIASEEPQADEFYQNGVRPQIFKTLIGKGHPEFQTGQQQDAREYFSHLLEQVMKAEKQAKASDPGQLFQFELEKRLQCTECHRVKYQTEKDTMLNITAPVSSKVEKGTPVDFNECVENFFAEHHLEDVQCSQCQKKTTYSQRTRFIRHPKTLCVVLQRFVFDDWVPKKLEIELQIPDGKTIDFEKYKSANNGQPLPDEQTFPDAAAGGGDIEEEPELDQGQLNMVLQMGIPENPAKHALYKSGGNNADMAVAWYFEHMDDPSIQQPLRIKKAAAAASSGPEVPAESLAMMVTMGFPEKKCIKALKKCDMNMERATDWLFSHMDDPDSDGDSVMLNEESKEDLQDFKCDKPGNYQLSSFITHLGASVHAGHYVCHIKKNNDWAYFNDDKVAHTMEPPIGKGYMYFFKKE